MRITFCGAARTVTGSCHLVEVDGLRVLLDCGFFQGARDQDANNRAAFPFDAKSIDFVLLSHAHLDHAGLLPRLVREGFAGRVLCTRPTAEIARLMLADSAHLQVEDAAYKTRKARRRGEPAVQPLYNMDDVLRSIELFRPVSGYGVATELKGKTACVFHDAGHILGSACIELRASSGNLLFSGDLGNRHKPIVRDPSVPPRADVVLVESTYGNRRHRTIEESVAELGEAVSAVVSQGGNLLIPSFALERTQEVLYELFRFWRERVLPPCTIYVDSPLATSTTRVFERFLDYFDDEGRRVFSARPNPFEFPPLQYVDTVDASRKINSLPKGHVIIAGSGMCNGGRIIHHLRHNLWDEKSGVVFVGYQAAGTLGRRLVDGEPSVRIFGEEVAVRARVWTVGGFSSHADQPGLIAWVREASPGHLFLIHGEEVALEGFRLALRGELSVEPVLANWRETVSV
jgi:metallo-beta-lactamase family protein